MNDEAARKDQQTGGSPPFLETDPPHWVARGLAWLLILLFATVSVVSAVIHIPETISSAFVLIPVQGTDPVRASRSGVVTAVRVDDGQTVAKGDPLFVIQSAPVGDRSAELETLEAEIAGSRGSLVNAGKKYESQRLADEEEDRRLKARLPHLERTININTKQLALTKELAERYEKLHEKGFTSWAETINHEVEANKIAVELQRSQTEREETRSAIEKLRHESDVRATEHGEVERSLNERIERASIRIAALTTDLANSRSSQFSVSAPCAGTVLRLRVNAPGAVVRDGDVLCELGCAGGRLQAELTVPPIDVGRLQPGLGVKLLYDAFPYQRYGVRYGTVRWVSPAGVTVKETPAFRALVDIDNETIVVKGQPRPLLAGMGGTARVVVGRRSLISYAYDPIRQLRENLASAPEKPVPTPSAGNPSHED